MAGPSTTGTLGLDISDFDKAWHSAIGNIAKLEPELKQANAALKLMERQFRGAAAGANVSTKALERQRRVVASLKAELKAEKAERDAFAAATGAGGGGSDKGLISKLTKAGIIGAIGSFATTFLTTARGASELTKQLDDMDMSSYGDDFKEADKDALAFKGTLLDLAGAASNIPIVGKLFDSLASPIKMAADAVQSYRQASIEMNKEAVTTEDLLQKLNKLTFERAKITKEIADSDGARQKVIEGMGKFGEKFSGSPADDMFGTIRAKREEQLNSIQATRAQVVQKIARQAQLEANARNGILAGSEKQSQLDAIELQRQQKSAALIEAVKNKFGNIDGTGKKAYSAASKQIEAETDAQRAQVEVAYELPLTLLRLQTQAVEAQLKGMKGVAEQAGIAARFDKEIVAQLSAGNKEAAELIKRQKEIALTQEKALEHDITPRERLDARQEAKDVARKAKQEDARENERRNRGKQAGGPGQGLSTGTLTTGGLRTGNLNAPTRRDPGIIEQQLIDRNANESKLRMEQAATNMKALQQVLQPIMSDLSSMASAIKADK